MKSSKIKNRREDNSWERPTKESVSGRLVGEIKQEDERMGRVGFKGSVDEFCEEVASGRLRV